MFTELSELRPLIQARDLVRGWSCAAIAAAVLLVWVGASHGAAALRFGYPAIEDPTVTLGKYQRVLDAMAEVIGRPVPLVLRDTYAQVIRDFERGDVELGILNAFSYVEIAPRAQLTPLARRVRAGRDTYQSYLVVREGAGIARYEELRGKVIAFPDSRSTTGYLLPRLMLRHHQLELTRDFLQVLFVGKHDSTALAVANGTADAGALASYIFEDLEPAVQVKLRILDRSAAIPYGPVVARADLGGELLERIRSFFVTMDRTPQGKAVLKEARLSGFTAARDEDYATIRTLIRRMRAGGP